MPKGPQGQKRPADVIGNAVTTELGPITTFQGRGTSEFRMKKSGKKTTTASNLPESVEPQEPDDLSPDHSQCGVNLLAGVA